MVTPVHAPAIDTKPAFRPPAGTSSTGPGPIPEPFTPARRTPGRGAASLARAEATAHLLARAAGAQSESERRALLDQVVITNLGVARALAHRYHHRGLAAEDLEQVAYLALTRAAAKFDASKAQDFLTYAVPTIRGELKKHFRDAGWTIRPTRRIQDLQARISTVREDLTHQLHRSPTVADLAAELDVDDEDVIEAIATDGCFSPASLDRPLGESTDATVGDLLPTEDPERNAVEARAVLAPVVRRLAPRDRRIVFLRFFEERTQQEIADDIGVTQMQVSRILARILHDLRDQLEHQPRPSRPRATVSD